MEEGETPSNSPGPAPSASRALPAGSSLPPKPVQDRLPPRGPPPRNRGTVRPTTHRGRPPQSPGYNSRGGPPHPYAREWEEYYRAQDAYRDYYRPPPGYRERDRYPSRYEHPHRDRRSRSPHYRRSPPPRRDRSPRRSRSRSPLKLGSHDLSPTRPASRGRGRPARGGGYRERDARRSRSYSRSPSPPLLKHRLSGRLPSGVSTSGLPSKPLRTYDSYSRDRERERRERDRERTKSPHPPRRRSRSRSRSRSPLPERFRSPSPSLRRQRSPSPMRVDTLKPSDGEAKQKAVEPTPTISTTEDDVDMFDVKKEDNINIKQPQTPVETLTEIPSLPRTSSLPTGPSSLPAKPLSIATSGLTPRQAAQTKPLNKASAPPTGPRIMKSAWGDNIASTSNSSRTESAPPKPGWDDGGSAWSEQSSDVKRDGSGLWGNSGWTTTDVTPAAPSRADDNRAGNFTKLPASERNEDRLSPPGFKPIPTAPRERPSTPLGPKGMPPTGPRASRVSSTSLSVVPSKPSTPVIPDPPLQSSMNPYFDIPPEISSVPVAPFVPGPRYSRHVGKIMDEVRDALDRDAGRRLSGKLMAEIDKKFEYLPPSRTSVIAGIKPDLEYAKKVLVLSHLRNMAAWDLKHLVARRTIIAASQDL
ncbi:hypothetical protein DL96DRAFT_1598566 [Flagelloscypha sp. PMI_526]|nr:hypothetical protein DL96DRAFT_1598566 [Flagelloscypha sp. PMI_526]